MRARLLLLVIGLTLLLASALPAPAQTGTRVVVAGDLALQNDTADGRVSDFALTLGADYTLTLGDNTNDSKSLVCDESPCSAFDTYDSYFAPTWGRLPNLRPAPGNHDYLANAGADYLAWFDVPPYYSFDVPGWHVVSLNSQLKNLTPEKEYNAEKTWLEADLAAVPAGVSILAYFHYPRYSISSHHSGYTKVQPLWDILAAHPGAPAKLVLNGHNHLYERYAPINGIVEAIVSTGGANPASGTTTRSPMPVAWDLGYHVAELWLEADGSYAATVYDVNGQTGAAAIVDTFGAATPPTPTPTPTPTVTLGSGVSGLTCADGSFPAVETTSPLLVRCP